MREIPKTQKRLLHGFVLCGGASRRMGNDKSLLAHPSGGTLLDHAVALTLAFCANVTLLSGAKKRYAASGHDEIADLAPGLGPLGGIEAALGRAETHPTLIVPIDLPALQIEHLSKLADAYWASESLLATAVDGAGKHSALAIWDPKNRGAVRDAIAIGRRSLYPFAMNPSALRVELPNAALANWNRPDDLPEPD